MLEPDIGAAAALLAERGRVRGGDRVLLLCHDAGFALADALFAECYRRGAVPFVATMREEALLRAYHEAPADALAQSPSHAAAMVAASDVVFFLYSQEKNPALLSRAPRDKLAAWMKSRAALQNALYDHRRRVVITDYPTAAQAEFFGADFDEYHDTFWRALFVDYAELGERTRGIAAFLEDCGEVHITSAKGTDVVLNVAGRRVFADDGYVDLPDEPDADTLLNLPAGEVCLAPREDGADGRAVFDFAFINGERVADLEISFEGGRGCLKQAAAGFECAVDYFASGTGDPYVIAELGIGVNPAITKPFGSILMDEKIAGTVHLALGDNRTMQGANVSSIHKDMIILAPRVTGGGRVLMESGELKI